LKISTIRNFRYAQLGVLILAAANFAQAAELKSEPLVTARQAVRCSVIYGMDSAASKDETRRARLLNIQRSLMAVAARIGGTRAMMEDWLAEFDKEFSNATSSDGPGAPMRDETFIPKEIDVCDIFLKLNREKFTSLMSAGGP
jgi:hypothetical protein